MGARERVFLDLGITSPLYLLITRCGNHFLRAQAVELFKGWHIEACWQPRLIAGIGEFLMDVEEEGNVAGIIPETSRAVITAVYNRPDGVNKCTALVQCVQRNRSPEIEKQIWYGMSVKYLTDTPDH
jgi:hypothetical protein